MTYQPKDITNCKFGKLLAIRITDERKHGCAVWEFKCDCGATHYTVASSVIKGASTSCGKCNKGKQEAFCESCGVITGRYKSGHCKKCTAVIRKKYYKTHQDKIKDYRLKTKEIRKDKRKLDRSTEEHKIKRRLWEASYIKNKCKQDNFFKFKRHIHSLVTRRFCKGIYTKRSHAFELIGCSYTDLFTYIGNKPSNDYHLDHICPLAQAQNEAEYTKLWHYSNLRWITKEENLSKSDNKTPDGERLCRKLLERGWIDEQ